MANQTFHLSPADRAHLQSLLRKGSLSVHAFKRATGLLQSDNGRTSASIATGLDVSERTVVYWRKNYREQGLQMLTDKPRSGRPIKIDGAQRAKVTALACSQPPEGRARWSLRLLADRVVELDFIETVSHTHIATILKKTNSNRI